MKFFCSSLVVALTALFALQTHAQSPQTLVVAQDSYINEKQQGNNFGSSIDVVVHNYGPKIGLAQFDTSTLSGEVVDSAYLRFRLNSLKNAGTINLQLVNQAWSENTLTAGNQPAFSATAISIPVALTDVGTVVSVDITGIVQGWADVPSSNHGIRLQTADNIKAAIDSLNSSGMPMELLVTTSGVPPGSAQVFDVAEDSYIIGLQPGNNFGANYDVVVHNYGPKVGLARFDLTSLSGSDVTGAMLKFRLNSIRNPGIINLQLIDQTWSEATVTYGNQPLYIGTVLSIPVAPADAGRVISVDVTGIVQSWVNGSQPNHGIRLQTDDNIRAAIDSLDSPGTPMQLVVTTAVGPPNAPPVLAAIGSQSVNVGEQLQFAVSATDTDGTVPALQAANLPGFATLADFSATGASGTFTWTPTVADIGTYPTVTFTAVDADDPLVTSSETITVTVNSGGATSVTADVTQDTYVNPLQPTVNFGTRDTVLVHNYGPKAGLVQFDLSSLTGTAVRNASLHFRVKNLKNPGSINLQMIDAPWSELTATGGNQPAYSVATTAVPLTMADVGQVVAADVTDMVQSWYDGSRPNHGFRLQTDQNIKAEIDSLNSTGTPMSLVVTMYDGPTNVAPVLAAIGPRNVGEAGSLSIGLSATDANNDGLVFTASGLPDFATLTSGVPGSAVIQANPGPNDAGSYTVTVTVADDSFPPLSDEETFTLTVAEVNQAPTDISLSNFSVFDGIISGSLVGLLSTADPDNGDIHTYTLDDDAGGRFVLGGLNGVELRVLDTALIDAATASSHDVTVTATDSGGLPVTRTFTISVGMNSAPTVNISSHVANENVPVSGFILSGTATDDFGITGFTATVSDPLLGITVNEKPVSIASNSGNWSLVVFSGQLSMGKTITVTLTAVDGAGLTTLATIDLDAVATNRSGRHAINRITFGATPTLLHEVDSIGAAAFIAQQLDPASIDDSSFDTMMAGFTPTTLAELQRYQFLHAVYSRRQLREVLTQFWDNHFNTNIHSHENVQYELAENNLFRANALGNFRALLEISAKSPAMLYYLNGASNVAADPNENYARELMELHTLSVDGGYTQSDVDEVARVLTGWTVNTHAFYFDAVSHDNLPKVVLGQVIPVSGQPEGEAVLDMLAAHPSTAGFVCEKLIALFVDDLPPVSLVSNCAATFLATVNAPDQIAQVVALILGSTEFSDAAFYHNKVKTPFEFAVGAVRQLQAQGTFDDLPSASARMGMPLFENHIPTGYSEVAEDWVSSNLIVERMKFANEVAFNPVGGVGVSIEPLSFFPAQGYETDDGIVGYLFELAIDDDITPLEWQTAMNVLTNNGTEQFDLSATDAEQKLRRLIGTVLSYPAYNYQ